MRQCRSENTTFICLAKESPDGRDQLLKIWPVPGIQIVETAERDASRKKQQLKGVGWGVRANFLPLSSSIFFPLSDFAPHSTI